MNKRLRFIPNYYGHASTKARSLFCGAFRETFVNGTVLGVAVLGFAVCLVFWTPETS